MKDLFIYVYLNYVYYVCIGTMLLWVFIIIAFGISELIKYIKGRRK